MGILFPIAPYLPIGMFHTKQTPLMLEIRLHMTNDCSTYPSYLPVLPHFLFPLKEESFHLLHDLLISRVYRRVFFLMLSDVPLKNAADCNLSGTRATPGSLRFCVSCRAHEAGLKGPMARAIGFPGAGSNSSQTPPSSSFTKTWWTMTRSTSSS